MSRRLILLACLDTSYLSSLALFQGGALESISRCDKRRRERIAHVRFGLQLKIGKRVCSLARSPNRRARRRRRRPLLPLIKVVARSVHVHPSIPILACRCSRLPIHT